MEKKVFIKINQYTNNKNEGGYCMPFIESEKCLLGELITMFENKEIDTEREVRFKLVYMTEQEYGNLSEFKGY